LTQSTKVVRLVTQVRSLVISCSWANDLAARIFDPRGYLSTLVSTKVFMTSTIRPITSESMAFTCKPCEKSFKTKESLQQHFEASPRHKSNQYCKVCDRYFNQVEGLQQHLRSSKAHNGGVAGAAAPTPAPAPAPFASVKPATNGNTPLDKFFLSFPSFDYDASLPPAKSYSLLRRHMAWPRNSIDGDLAWQNYRQALVDEVRIWFGNESDLAAWHTLCRAIGIQQAPETINACVSVSQLRIPA